MYVRYRYSAAHVAFRAFLKWERILAKSKIKEKHKKTIDLIDEKNDSDISRKDSPNSYVYLYIERLHTQKKKILSICVHRDTQFIPI